MTSSSSTVSDGSGGPGGRGNIRGQQIQQLRSDKVMERSDTVVDYFRHARGQYRQNRGRQTDMDMSRSVISYRGLIQERILSDSADLVTSAVVVGATALAAAAVDKGSSDHIKYAQPDLNLIFLITVRHT